MLHATCVPLHASCYPTPTLGNVCDEGAEVCVEVVGGGGWSLLLPVIARICERAHSRLMSTTGGLSPAFASLTSWAFFGVPKGLKTSKDTTRCTTPHHENTNTPHPPPRREINRVYGSILECLLERRSLYGR